MENAEQYALQDNFVARDSAAPLDKSTAVEHALTPEKIAAIADVVVTGALQHQEPHKAHALQENV